MNVLISCEYSGVVRDAFSRAGHNAWSCDLLDTESEMTKQEGKHIKADAIEAAYGYKWDLMIAHPPCTYLANSGVCHLYKDKERWKDLIDGACFFRDLLNAPIKKIAVENPIMHKYAKKIIGRGQDQVIQPWMFGHSEQKATCLWLKGLPKLKETNNVKEKMMDLPNNERQRLHYLPPSEDRWKERSKTFEGIAQAMVKQWGHNE